MHETGSSSTRLPPQVEGHSRPTSRLALAAAAVVCVLSIVGTLPAIYTLPLIGLLTAWSAPPDRVPEARVLAASSRNLVIGFMVLAALAVVAFQDRLQRLLIVRFGTDLDSLVIVLLSVAVLALPMAMVESTTRVADLPAHRLVLSKRNVLLALTGMVTIATWHATVGLSFLPLAVLVLCVPVVLTASRIGRARHGRVEQGLWRHLLRPGLGMHRLQLFNILLFSGLMGLAVQAGTFDITRLYLSVGGYRVFQIAFVVGLVTLVILALVPLSHVYLGTNLAVAAGSAFLALQLIMIYQPPSEPVTIVSPLSEEWYVSQGGHAELVNYHYVTSAQRDALDIVQIVDGHTRPPGTSDLDSYYIFGDPLLAPADGVVTSVVDGLADQPIGSGDNEHQAGNQIVIDIAGGRYLMLAHIRQDSIEVAVGDRVAAGQVIAEVGNSGNSTEPHIHIQAFSLPSFELADDDLVELLRVARTYPLVFRDVVLTRNGSEFSPAVVDPRRGDLIKPVPPQTP